MFFLAGRLSLCAVYVYLAQVLGFWEPTRSRMGTGGQDFTSQSVVFSYRFHRALGSFREPSHLAQWIVPPLILGWRFDGKRAHMAKAAILAALALSGSLVGVLAAAAGFGSLAILNSSKMRGQFVSRLPFLLIVLTGTALLFDIPFWSTIGERIQTLASLDPFETNRAYVAEYVATHSPPLLGHGWGNASLMLSAERGLNLMSSHLNLFVNTYMSLGFLGLGLVVIALGSLALRAIRLLRGNQAGVDGAPLVAALIAWDVLFSGQAEIFPMQFSVVAGLIWHLCWLRRTSRN